MRVSLFLVVLTLNSIALKAQSLPEWYRVYTFDESTIDMNTRLVTAISKDVSRVRFRWTFNQPQSLGEIRYQSQLQVMEFNCRLKSYRPYHLTLLDSAGNIVHIDDSPREWSMVPLGSMTEKLFAPGCDLIKKNTASAPPGAEMQLEKVTKFAYAFGQDLEKAKDFKPLIDRFFMTNYLTGYLQDQKTNWFMNLDRDTASRVSKQELERFYVAQMNAGYLTSLYVISRLSYEPETAPLEKLMPPDVLHLISKHPYTARYKHRDGDYDFLGEKIDTVQRMRGYTDLLEKISSLMREHVRQVRAAHSTSWRVMLADWDLYQPTIRICAENCFGLPKGTRIFQVNVPVFRLEVAEVGGKLKVVSAISRF